MCDYVPLFTKQCKLVPCEGFHVDALFVVAMAWSPMNKGSIVEAVLHQSWSLLGRFPKNRYINYLLYFPFFFYLYSLTGILDLKPAHLLIVTLAYIKNQLACTS